MRKEIAEEYRKLISIQREVYYDIVQALLNHVGDIRSLARDSNTNERVRELEAENKNLAKKIEQMTKARDFLVEENRRQANEIKAKNKTFVKSCEKCGKTITVKSKNARYCEDCRKVAWYESQRKYQARLKKGKK